MATQYEKIRPPVQDSYIEVVETPARGKLTRIAAPAFRFFNQVAKQLNNTAGFVPRLDPSAADWVLAALTTDGAYHTLDASSIVDEGAVAVYLRVGVTDDAAGSLITFRKLGNSNEINVLRVATQVSGITNHIAGIVPITRDGLFEYKAENLTWSAITIEVCGWFV